MPATPNLPSCWPCSWSTPTRPTSSSTTRSRVTHQRGRMKDKVVIITGGTSGIGRAAALGFVQQGAKVIITGRRAGPLKEAMRDHPNIAGFTADVSVPAEAARTIHETLNTWGRVDILVNN